jgi:hypothetical protein
MFVTPVYITSLFKSTTFNGRMSRSSYVVRRRTPFASSASRIVRQLRNQRPPCLRRTNLLSCSRISLYPLPPFTSKLLCRYSLNPVPCYRDPSPRAQWTELVANHRLRSVLRCHKSVMVPSNLTSSITLLFSERARAGLKSSTHCSQHLLLPRLIYSAYRRH